MKNFCVLRHPTHGYDAVKMGFCWPAFFFTIVWTFCKRLWGVTAVLAGVVVLFVVVESNSGGTTSGRWGWITSLLLGMYGNRWRRWQLSKKGYEPLTIVAAQTPDLAIRKTQQGE